MIDLVFQNSTSDNQFDDKFFNEALRVGAGILDLDKKDIEISINLVGEDKIRELNREHRNKDKVTDVLSFPLESKPMKDISVWPLGDIFICLPFAKKEAKRQNISIDKELAWLTIHGFLHLLGHDHEKSEKDAKEMSDLENKILNKLNL